MYCIVYSCLLIQQSYHHFERCRSAGFPIPQCDEIDLCGFVHFVGPIGMMFWGCEMGFCMLYFGKATAEWKPCFSRFGSCPWGQRPSINETGPSQPRFPAGNLFAATKTGTSVRSGVSWRSEEEIVRQKMTQPEVSCIRRNLIVQDTLECWFHRRI